MREVGRVLVTLAAVLGLVIAVCPCQTMQSKFMELEAQVVCYRPGVSLRLLGQTNLA